MQKPGRRWGTQQDGHLRLAERQPHAVAPQAGLGDLEDRTADAVAVTDAHLAVGEPVTVGFSPNRPYVKSSRLG
ncbi:hypothetical protein [Streptomyces sp. NPDC048295]|uniref:hypothetical protein n=1 Tax=Streptomyces sp. NPDC048295 TaxID=3154617 RepID=UPI003429148F